MEIALVLIQSESWYIRDVLQKRNTDSLFKVGYFLIVPREYASSIKEVWDRDLLTNDERENYRMCLVGKVLFMASGSFTNW